MEFSFENISDSVFHHAAQYPQKPALIDGCETLFYGELATLIGQAAVYLSMLGIKAGDRVGIALTNSAVHVILSLATMRIGAVLIELPTDINSDILLARVRRFGISATFVESGGPLSPAPIAIRINLHWRNSISRLLGDARYNGDPENLRLIILSSGSTGIPKGIVTTHQQRILRSSTYLNRLGDVWSKDRPGTLVLATAPSASLFSQFLTIQLLLGGPIVLLPAFSHVIDLARELASWDDAIFPITPGVARGFTVYAEQPGILFPKMRALVVGGQPLASHDKLTLLERVTPNLYDVYGCAGCGLISHIGPADIAAQSNSVGRPVSSSGIEAEVVSSEGHAVAAGTMGQLRVRGPNISIGFYNAEDNALGTERFIDGWYYPGEVAALDQAGYLSLRGRMADAISLGTLTVYPQEIEDVITRHPAVAEAVVVGRPGATVGEELIAFIVGRSGFRHEDIAGHCRSQLPSERRPKLIYYMDKIPRTGNGKIDRPALKVAAVRQAETDVAVGRQPVN